MSRVPSAEDFADWLEGKDAGEKIGPQTETFMGCGGCALGQYAMERFEITTYYQFEELFDKHGPMNTMGGWASEVSWKHSSGSNTRESLLNVIAPYLEKEADIQLDKVEKEITSVETADERLTTYRESVRSFRIERVGK